MDKKARNVDEYILNQPEERREKLQLLRAVILSAASKAEEKINWGMPHYKYNGMLAFFAGFKKHYSLVIPSSKVFEIFKEELKNYSKAKATIHFMYDKKLPIGLVKKIIKTKVKENELKKK